MGILQYREKRDIPFEEKKNIGQRLKTLCRQYNTLFIVNDDVELAHALDADGVQLGQEDIVMTSITKA